MNIRRIIFGLSFLLVLALVGLAYQFIVLQRTNASVSQTYEKAAQARDLGVETYVVTDDLTRSMRTYVWTGDDKYASQYNQILAIREGKLERPVDYPHLYWGLINGGDENPRKGSGVTKSIFQLYEEAGYSKEEIAKLQKSVDNSNHLVQIERIAYNAFNGLFRDSKGNYSVVDTPNKQLARDLMFGELYHRLKYDILKPIDEAVDLMTARISKEISDELNKQETARQVFTVLLFLSLALVAAVGFAVREQNRRELAERTAAQQQAEAENEALNDSVINILSAVNQLSQRDLTAQAPVTEDIIGTVSDSINQLSSETAKVLHGVTDIAGQVQSVSGNVKQQASLVSQTAQEERNSVQSAIESLLDATQTMNQVAALAEQSNESATQVTDATNKALSTVDNTVTGMEQIRETIAESEKRIKRLGERSQEISGIVNLINTISERTHVLALNASMQAAVAGEAGRGFAVVAEEVQRLAESSRSATEQISTLVNNIQLETNETINTVNNTIAQVVEGSKQAQEAGEQMRITQQITDELVSQVARITQASEKQKSMSADLLVAVQNIGESTQKTAEQIETQNKQTDMLQLSASKLVDSVSVFNLPAKEAS